MKFVHQNYLLCVKLTKSVCILIQVAQSPQRNEPNAVGEVNFKYVFKVLVDVGYNDWVGCEYKPTNNSADNLDWIKEYGYSF